MLTNMGDITNERAATSVLSHASPSKSPRLTVLLVPSPERTDGARNPQPRRCVQVAANDDGYVVVYPEHQC